MIDTLQKIAIVFLDIRQDFFEIWRSAARAGIRIEGGKHGPLRNAWCAALCMRDREPADAGNHKHGQR
ncbi:MAG: hypothetical protein ABIQ51_26195 [Mesorhizobium sp.]